jgi:hypothetical protein
MARPPEVFDPSRPTNSVEATAEYVGCSRGVAYEMARTGAWPSTRAGHRLLVLTGPLLQILHVSPDDVERFVAGLSDQRTALEP